MNAAGGIIFALIVAGELIALFRLMLPRFIAFCEARHDAYYNRPNCDCLPVLILNDFHSQRGSDA